MKCECCEKVSESLTCLGPYNGNKDNTYYCDECFVKVNGEKVE